MVETRGDRGIEAPESDEDKMRTMILALAMTACAIPLETTTGQQAEMCFPACGGDGDAYTEEEAASATVDWQQTHSPGVAHDNTCFFESNTLINCSVHVGTKMVRCWFFLNQDGSLKDIVCQIVG